DIKYRQDEKGRHFAAVVCISIPGCHVHVLGLSRGTVPIFPSSTSIKHQTHTGQTTAKSFSRRQVPLVPAYSYTDYKSQGRTLTRAIVDVASARGQGVYVMLSRVKTRHGLLILRWFLESKVLQRMSGELRDELLRLESLD
ncbi:hypothetical protein FA13DRAFT_1607597, partial [Coprinellus micaceus]